MEKHQIKKFIAAAEEYYQKLDSLEYLKKKPFAHPDEGAAILYHVGLLLTELRLVEGQVVLDFGAGVCWLSRLLNRFSIGTIAVDVSHTALKLGKDLFKNDNCTNWTLKPQFITYDGFTLPFKDDSIDRIICYDSLHHLANIEEMMREFYRILKNGGRAAFREPGKGHADSSAAQYEIKRYGIIERDIDILDIAHISSNLGFDFFVKPYPEPASITFNSGQIAEFLGNSKAFPVDTIKESIVHNSIFIVTKGEQHFYSTSPQMLRAEIQLMDEGKSLSFKPNSFMKIIVQIKNTGNTIWLSKAKTEKGIVRIGAHLLNQSSEILSLDYFRADVPCDIFPGQVFTRELMIPVPAEAGNYKIVIDMVCESFYWFEWRDSPTLSIAVTVA